MALALLKRLPDKENISKTSPKKIKLCIQRNGFLKNQRKKMSLEDLLKRIVVPFPLLSHPFKAEKRKIVDTKKKINGQVQVNIEAVSPENCNSSTNTEGRTLVDARTKENDLVEDQKEAVSLIYTSKNSNNSSTNNQKGVFSAKENISSDLSINEKLFIEGNLVWAKLTLKESYWPELLWFITYPIIYCVITGLIWSHMLISVHCIPSEGELTLNGSFTDEVWD
ncbi:uncharacterized protein [Halyomorpha halys]|uniref:uncharacterized protein n=1 Tax=Halyomorpha halys TaxID=286706 RepID=UPI0006D4DB92